MAKQASTGNLVGDAMDSRLFCRVSAQSWTVSGNSCMLIRATKVASCLPSFHSLGILPSLHFSFNIHELRND